MSLEILIESLQINLTNSEWQQRKIGLQKIIDYLKLNLSNFSNENNSIQAATSLARYLTSRLEDHHELIPLAVECLQLLTIQHKLSDELIIAITKSLFDHADPHTLTKWHDRHVIYQFLNHLCKFHLSSLKLMEEEFVPGLVTLVDGESDPRNLLIVFDLVHSVLSNMTVGVMIDDYFEYLNNYFPINYNPPANDTRGVTRSQLVELHTKCMSSNNRLVPFVFPLILEHLTRSANDNDFERAPILECLQLLLSIVNVCTVSQLQEYQGSLLDGVLHEWKQHIAINCSSINNNDDPLLFLTNEIIISMIRVHVDSSASSSSSLVEFLNILWNRLSPEIFSDSIKSNFYSTAYCRLLCCIVNVDENVAQLFGCGKLLPTIRLRICGFLNELSSVENDRNASLLSFLFQTLVDLLLDVAKKYPNLITTHFAPILQDRPNPKIQSLMEWFSSCCVVASVNYHELDDAAVTWRLYFIVIRILYVLWTSKSNLDSAVKEYNVIWNASCNAIVQISLTEKETNWPIAWRNAVVPQFAQLLLHLAENLSSSSLCEQSEAMQSLYEYLSTTAIDQSKVDQFLLLLLERCCLDSDLLFNQFLPLFLQKSIQSGNVLTLWQTLQRIILKTNTNCLRLFQLECLHELFSLQTFIPLISDEQVLVAVVQLHSQALAVLDIKEQTLLMNKLFIENGGSGNLNFAVNDLRSIVLLSLIWGVKLQVLNENDNLLKSIQDFIYFFIKNIPRDDEKKQAALWMLAARTVAIFINKAHQLICDLKMIRDLVSDYKLGDILFAGNITAFVLHCPPTAGHLVSPAIDWLGSVLKHSDCCCDLIIQSLSKPCDFIDFQLCHVNCSFLYWQKVQVLLWSPWFTAASKEGSVESVMTLALLPQFPIEVIREVISENLNALIDLMLSQLNKSSNASPTAVNVALECLNHLLKETNQQNLLFERVPDIVKSLVALANAHYNKPLTGYGDDKSLKLTLNSRILLVDAFRQMIQVCKDQPTLLVPCHKNVLKLLKKIQDDHKRKVRFAAADCYAIWSRT